MDARDEMVRVNARQQAFYDSVYDAQRDAPTGEHEAAGSVTNLWNRLRVKVVELRRIAGVGQRMLELHRAWLPPLRGARVLDLCCFEGNDLSLELAEQAAEYVGVDLSPRAIAALGEKLRARGLSNARAEVVDLLANPWPDEHFDLVYAFSVLHHFKDPDVMLRELRRILKPGGVVISFDPLQTEPMNRLARLLYRPLQSDRDWEWPFTRRTFRAIERHFEIDAVQGFMGMSKLGFPFLVVPGLGGLGQRVARWGQGFDERRANRMGWPFDFCWQAAMRLRRPGR